MTAKKLKETVNNWRRIISIPDRVSHTYEEEFDAASVEEAEAKWEDQDHDGEIYYIEDEDENQVFYHLI